MFNARGNHRSEKPFRGEEKNHICLDFRHSNSSKSYFHLTGATIVIIDFSLTVKAATLIFISGLCLAISSAKEGKSGFIYYLIKSLLSFFGHANVRAFHENPNRIHTELTFINP